MALFSKPPAKKAGSPLDVVWPRPGAIAVWGPTGLSLSEEAVILDQELFEALFGAGKRILGEATRQALQEGRKNGVEGFMLEIYNLIGDPALRVRQRKDGNDLYRKE